uniref:Protein kinase domain-containing protein n=1 Tax=Cyclophora tenuis TaxID=216820 RepID=A0A7S1CYF6_CYCTE
MERLEKTLADQMNEWRIRQQQLQSPQHQKQQQKQQQQQQQQQPDKPKERKFGFPFWGGNNNGVSQQRQNFLRERMGVALQLAQALQYLHSRSVVHRDLKAANIGFDSNGVLKLFDFGLAQKLTHVSSSEFTLGGNIGGRNAATGANMMMKRRRRRRQAILAGTPCYMAPELYLAPPKRSKSLPVPPTSTTSLNTTTTTASTTTMSATTTRSICRNSLLAGNGAASPSSTTNHNGVVDTATDVYTYGLILWELLSLESVFLGYTEKRYRKRVVQQGERPRLRFGWPGILKTLLTKCWSPEPEDRPTMSHVVQQLNRYLNK